MGVATEDGTRETVEDRIIAVAVALGELVEVQDPETGARHYIGTEVKMGLPSAPRRPRPALTSYGRITRTAMLVLSVVLVGGACASAVFRLDPPDSGQVRREAGDVSWVVRSDQPGFSNPCSSKAKPATCVASAQDSDDEGV